ncbi:MAG: hypothetical protein RR975_04535 [Clostridia bacterium]
MKKVISVLLVLSLCLSVGLALATNAETGEVNGVKDGAITVYDGVQYKQIAAGEALHGAKAGTEAKAAVAALLTGLAADTNVKSFKIAGVDAKAMDALKDESAEVKPSAILTFLGFFKADEQADDVKAAIAKLKDAGINATETPATAITFEGKDAELRTITIEVEGKDGAKTYERFNFVRIVGETEWKLVTISNSVQ